MLADGAQATRAEIGKLALFSGLTEPTLEFLQLRLRSRRYERGRSIFVEGDPGASLFMVLTGEVEILKASQHGQQVRLGTLGPGRWFGEAGLLDMEAREAEVRALTDVEMLLLTSADLDALYRHDARAYSLVVLNLARGLSRRLRSAHRLLANALAKQT